MRKRQRKKNQQKAKADVDFLQFAQILRPMLEQKNLELKKRCHWRGHAYRLVNWPDYTGYICQCCGEKINAREL